MAGSWEHGIEPSGSIKFGELTEEAFASLWSLRTHTHLIITCANRHRILSCNVQDSSYPACDFL